MSLVEWDFEKKFTIVGTMRHDRKGIPKELKSVNDREEMSALYVYHEEKDVMLVSYIDKEKWCKKNVIVITTMHDNVKVANDRQKKPHVHVMYDHTKGGFDIVNKSFNQNQIEEMAFERICVCIGHTKKQC